MKKAIIYDLDYTLFDPNTLDIGLFYVTFAILKEVEQTSESSFTELKNAFFSLPLKTFIEKHLDLETSNRFVHSLNAIIALPTLKTYSDAVIVPQLKTTNYLITSGPSQFQNQKIDALGIREWFSEIYVDDPTISTWKDKEEIMRLIIDENHYDVSEVLVVGDNPDSEIQAGNNIGIETIQIMRNGVMPSQKATYRIKDLIELNNYI